MVDLINSNDGKECMITRKVSLRSNKGMLRAIYRWFSSFGDTDKLNRTIRFRHNPIKFYCMNCGKEHGKVACPQCGSKAVRLG
jgi:predicted RNA-binding Zn-ribbon protein involved in translation (DUF1610 family)